MNCAVLNKFQFKYTSCTRIVQHFLLDFVDGNCEWRNRCSTTSLHGIGNGGTECVIAHVVIDEGWNKYRWQLEIGFFGCGNFSAITIAAAEIRQSEIGNDLMLFYLNLLNGDK